MICRMNSHTKSRIKNFMRHRIKKNKNKRLKEKHYLFISQLDHNDPVILASKLHKWNTILDIKELKTILSNNGPNYDFTYVLNCRNTKNKERTKQDNLYNWNQESSLNSHTSNFILRTAITTIFQ